MAIPFAKMHTAVVKDRQEREVREVLSKFAKAVAGKSSYKVMREYDQRMCDLSLEDAGCVLMSCIPDNPLCADLYVQISSPISILTLFRGDFSKGELRSILLKLAKSHTQGSEAVVIFKVKHFGAWVAYNTADPFPLSTPRITIPANTKGQSSITIMPINTYINMWNAKRGES